MVSNKEKVKNIIIVGAGGFGKEVLWTLLDCNKKSEIYNFLGFIDDSESLKNQHIYGFPVLGGIDWFSSNNINEISCVIGIGDPKLRRQVVNKLEKIGVEFATVIHPSVIHSEFLEIGKGTIIQAGCIITVDTKIGDHVHINIDTTIGHNCMIKNFVTLNPGVHINGWTDIDEEAYVGTGAVAIDRIKIGKKSVIAAGTVLISNVPDFSMYAGVPGKFKKKLPRC